MLLQFGIKPEAIRLICLEPKPGDPERLPEGLTYPQPESLLRMTEVLFRQQLLPGKKMDSMSSKFLDHLSDSMRWESMDFCTLESTLDKRTISLRRFLERIFVDATIVSIFGRHIHDIKADVADDLLEFNSNIWMIMFRYPELLSSAVRNPQKRLLPAFVEFLQLPEEARSEQAWYIKTLLQAQDHLKIDMHSRASILLMITFAATLNNASSSFWLLAELLFDQHLFQEVQGEINAAWSTGSLDIKGLCAKSPKLNAAWDETLRVTTGNVVTREVVARTELGGKILEPGNTLIIPMRQLHRDERVWGESADTFDATRFAQRKDLLRHPAYRPFGGGVTLCPGRALAKEEAFGFVAMLLHRYDIVLDTKAKQQTFPEFDRKKPVIGLIPPADEADIILEVTPRAKGWLK
ncbi:MAG: hypothetical protein Q9162_000552 [Coniocarpon cinnabarinum]